MKTTSVILALFAICFCVRGAVSSDWESEVVHKFSQKDLQTTPKITVQKVVQDSNQGNVVLLVENRTGIDLAYNGYSEKGPQLFVKQKRYGKWVATSWDWCGTGMEKHVLRNQQTAAFHVRVGQDPVQVFTIFRNANDPDQYSLVKVYENDGD
jgi:hypothetical protein